VVAIGETGLDYYYGRENRTASRTGSAIHIAAARELGKPLIVHTRDARADTLRILAEEGAAEVGGVLHCFTEDWAMAEQALELNFLHLIFRHRDLQKRPADSGRGNGACPPTGCWSKPTRPIWRRSRTGVNPISRPGCGMWRNLSPAARRVAGAGGRDHHRQLFSAIRSHPGGGVNGRRNCATGFGAACTPPINWTRSPAIMRWRGWNAKSGP
jgi:hypothetical protein